MSEEEPLTKIARFMDGLLETEGPTVKGVGCETGRTSGSVRPNSRALQVGDEPFTVNDLAAPTSTQPTRSGSIT
jgi:hypothetical protein